MIIIGAGFSGTVLAANLLRRPPSQPMDIVLVERGGAIGRGVAYATHEFPYLLNVPAARLSVDSADPLQFLRYARVRFADADGEDFLPRSLYGDYLQDLLLQAERAAPEHVRLIRVFDEVSAILRRDGEKPLAAQFVRRAPLLADFVILALGTPRPPLPAWAADVWQHSAFRQDPRDLPDTLAAEHSVLIVGNGLTMADAASVLSRDADRVPQLHTISRRGLLPRPQTAFRAGAIQGDGETLLARAQSLKQLLNACRMLAREVETSGGDWREAVTLVRHLAPGLWRALPAVERRRFVRHLQAHWDVHRHRLPPQMSARIEDLRRSGRLQVNAGRIQSVVAADHRLRVTWRPRGSVATSLLTVDLVVNATGPHFEIENSADALLNSLRAAGLVSADELRLGIRTARYGACLDTQGIASEHLFYLGPMLRADHWEATAALELRDHAEQLAAHLARACGQPGEKS
ncbi:MAG: FAD/NAD(P)-binding protein [Steroidobacteraceae bacterium]